MMSWGPVTACATETPCTCRSLPATSRAFPGEVSMRMKALTAMCVPPRRLPSSRYANAGRARSSERRRRHRVSVLIIGIETASGLASQVTRIDVLLEQRTGAIFVVAQHPMHHFHDRQAGVESDKVGEFQRPHRLIGPQLHRGIDVGDA